VGKRSLKGGLELVNICRCSEKQECFQTSMQRLAAPISPPGASAVDSALCDCDGRHWV